MKKKFWSSDKVVSIAAISISLFTLFIFIKQTNVIEEQSQRSVMPYLLLERSNNGDLKEFAIDVVNQGVGPAIITQKVIKYKGKSFDLEFVDFLLQEIPEADSINIINRSSLSKGFAIPAGKSRNIIRVGGDPRSYLTFLKIMQGLENSDFYYEITYKSLYDEHWRIDSKLDGPEALND